MRDSSKDFRYLVLGAVLSLVSIIMLVTTTEGTLHWKRYLSSMTTAITMLTIWSILRYRKRGFLEKEIKVIFFVAALIMVPVVFFGYFDVAGNHGEFGLFYNP